MSSNKREQEEVSEEPEKRQKLEVFHVVTVEDNKMIHQVFEQEKEYVEFVGDGEYHLLVMQRGNEVRFGVGDSVFSSLEVLKNEEARLWVLNEDDKFVEERVETDGYSHMKMYVSSEHYTFGARVVRNRLLILVPDELEEFMDKFDSYRVFLRGCFISAITKLDGDILDQHFGGGKSWDIVEKEYFAGVQGNHLVICQESGSGYYGFILKSIVSCDWMNYLKEIKDDESVLWTITQDNKLSFWNENIEDASDFIDAIQEMDLHSSRHMIWFKKQGDDLFAMYPKQCRELLKLLETFVNKFETQ